MGIQTSLDAVLQADRLVDSIRLADDLAFEASRDGGPRTVRVLRSALNSDDQLAAIAATHALAKIFDEQADVALSRLLSSSRGFMREHAAWALSLRLPRFDTFGRLIGLVSAGGFGGMLAQRTLEQWGSPVAEHVMIGLESALLGVEEPGARYRLVETLGLVRKSVATPALLRIATDLGEHELVRVAAVSALGQRRGDSEIVLILKNLARSSGHLGEVARLSLVDLSDEPIAVPKLRPALTIAQLFLHADLDAELTQAGNGDNGGIATLLVRLGDALATKQSSSNRVERVITLSRGSVADALASVGEIGFGERGHDFGRVPLLSDPVQSANAWPLRVAARRGIRRMLRAAGGVDLFHLRMADVGSLAASDVARELDIPMVFTVAPDPHAFIHSLDLSGRLTRQNFGAVDEVEHFWFRTHLVQQLAANAAHTVLFPRPSLARDMRELVNIDITAHPERHSIVPEGIDLEVIDRAVGECADHAAGLPASPAIQELRDLLANLPEERRGLPLLVSVGRFHRVKGMSTIVDAWANGSLAARANLLLIGGNLTDPSIDEGEQLDLINAIVPVERRHTVGLMLSGHRRNDTVARWVAATRLGLPGLNAPGGIYVCGSVKEEFGIALLEAMGSGLLVVAPDAGGPATYVEHGVTGFLTTTWDVELLAGALAAALDTSLAETTNERADISRATVESSFTIQAMALTLSQVYQRVQEEESESRGWTLAAL